MSDRDESKLEEILLRQLIGFNVPAAPVAIPGLLLLYWAYPDTVLLILAASIVPTVVLQRFAIYYADRGRVSEGITALAFAIWFTEQLMRHYTFPADELAIHLVFAKAGGLMAIPVVVTGIWLWRSERARKWHRVMVFLWLASVVTATATGLWMFSLGTAKII